MPRMMSLTSLRGRMMVWSVRQIDAYIDMIERWRDKSIAGIETFSKAVIWMLRKEIARRAVEAEKQLTERPQAGAEISPRS